MSGDLYGSLAAYNAGSQKVLKNIDVAKAAGGGMRGIVKEFKGIRVGRMLELSLTAKADVPILSGIELLLERF